MDKMEAMTTRDWIAGLLSELSQMVPPTEGSGHALFLHDGKIAIQLRFDPSGWNLYYLEDRDFLLTPAELAAEIQKLHEQEMSRLMVNGK
jgi:hypothetical protein